MLSAQEIANYLQSGLDDIGTKLADPFEFSILAESGKGYDGSKVNGMVKTVSPELAPFPSGYVEAKYVFVVEMSVTGPENYYYLCVNDIINTFIKQNQSSNVQFENGKGVVTFSMGVPKGYRIEYGVGESVPLTFTVHVTYTENAVTSGDKHWLLDGVEIPFLSESVSVEREGITRKIYTEVYSKILLTGQTKFYTFRIPYESSTFKSLQFEILQAPAVNKVIHSLTYYDGEAFTEENPYTTKVSIYRSANSGSTRPNASAYDVTFTDVYNTDGQALKYYMALIDFPFDAQSDDTRYFANTAEQTEYFEAKAAASSAPFIEIEAPNLDGLVITKQVYRAPAPSAISQFDLVSKNYAIIKVVSADKTLYFFYFIENATIGADGCVLVDLKMDSVQTYFFRTDVTFSDCLIERAHLNRFVDIGQGNVGFVRDAASKIYNAEAGLNFPKRLVKREKLKLQFAGNEIIDGWLNENIAYWVYIFIDPSHQYNVAEIKNNDSIVAKKVNPENGRVKYPVGMNGATNCISYPIYKNDNSDGQNNIVVHVNFIDGASSETIDISLSSAAKEQFEKLNAETSYYYSIKLSVLPPFDKVALGSMAPYIIPSTNTLVINATVNLKSGDRAYAKIDGADVAVICTKTANNSYSGLLYGSTQNRTAISANFNLPENNIALKTNITAPQPPNPAYNPKLNGQNFKELVITASSGDNFAYDIQKLTAPQLIFYYSEPITPEITKYYLRVQGDTGLYETGTSENYTGLVGSTDSSLAYCNDQYAEFIANNKNFYLQSNMKIVTGLVNSQIGAGIQAAGSATTGDMIGVASAAASSLTSKINAAVSFIDQGLTMNNLRNAPDQLKNANGSVIFNMFATDLGLYVEKYEALESDLKTANDFMNLYGFTFSAVANVRDYTHIRKYHNYVKAQLQSINGNLSNVARADLRQRFANGVRFWNQDTVSYNRENYEIWLELNE